MTSRWIWDGAGPPSKYQEETTTVYGGGIGADNEQEALGWCRFFSPPTTNNQEYITTTGYLK